MLLDPRAIVAGEPDRVTGLRRLYVCLTRAVTSLVVLHTRPLPGGAAWPSRLIEPADRWPLPMRTTCATRLLAAYADPARGYHDTLHLTEVLDRLDELAAAGEAFDRRPCGLAAWFHDAVYDGRAGAEERSAQWAERRRSATPRSPAWSG